MKADVAERLKALAAPRRRGRRRATRSAPSTPRPSWPPRRLQDVLQERQQRLDDYDKVVQGAERSEEARRRPRPPARRGEGRAAAGPGAVEPAARRPPPRRLHPEGRGRRGGSRPDEGGDRGAQERRQGVPGQARRRPLPSPRRKPRAAGRFAGGARQDRPAPRRPQGAGRGADGRARRQVGRRPQARRGEGDQPADRA